MFGGDQIRGTRARAARAPPRSAAGPRYYL